MGKTAQNVLCRHCYELFRYDRIGVRCISQRCRRVPDDRGRERPRFFDPRVYKLWERGRLTLDQDPACPFCERKGRMAPACPLCRHELDASVGEIDDHVIGVIGATGAGKTHYLATVLHQFLEGGVGGDSWTVQFANPKESKVFHREFLDPLFKDKKELKATPAVVGQEFRILLENQQRGQNVLLVFRDLGGELFADPRKLEKVKFLKYATGVVLITDPLAFEPQSLEDVQSWEPSGKPTAVEVLENYREVLEDSEHPAAHEALPLRPEEKFLAVAVTKADLVLGNDHAFWQTSEGAGAQAGKPGFWQSRQEESREGQEWIRRYLGTELTQIADEFADVGYFFVSSFGYRHEPKTHMTEKPQPLRVHEPIFALLDRFVQGTPQRRTRAQEAEDEEL